MSVRNVAVLIFDEIEVLDFAGPFEVFSVVGPSNDMELFNTHTVAKTAVPVAARNQLVVTPRYSFADCPKPDIVIVPGGYGTRKLLDDDETLSWIKETSASAELTLSVCTGALLLGKVGILDNIPATTHHLSLELLKEISPTTTVIADRRFVDDGTIVTSAGVTAGIDMAFHVLEKLHGAAIAEKTARYIEYRWQR